MTEIDTLQLQFARQEFANGYALVNGVAMHEENPHRFHIPPPVLKKHVALGHFVELRIDSPRFSVHADAPVKCTCASCSGEATKPILRHDHPASLLKLPLQKVPSRGWGEDFWAQVVQRDGKFFKVVVDNPLYEARLHGINQGDRIIIRADHILAVHHIHRQEMVSGMSVQDVKELVRWLSSTRS